MKSILTKKVKISNSKNYGSRKYIAVICFALAFVIGFVALPITFSKKNDTARIVIAAKNIKSGDKITAENVVLKEVGTYGQQCYVTSTKSILGKAAAADLFKGDILTSEKVGMGKGNEIQRLAKEHKSLTTISVVSNAAGVATHLVPGDCIDVYKITKGEYEQAAITLLPELSGLEVYDVENSAGRSTSEKNEIEGTSGNDQIVTTVTVITASKEQEQALIDGEYNGGLHLVLTGRK